MTFDSRDPPDIGTTITTTTTTTAAPNFRDDESRVKYHGMTEELRNEPSQSYKIHYLSSKIPNNNGKNGADDDDTYGFDIEIDRMPAMDNNNVVEWNKHLTPSMLAKQQQSQDGTNSDLEDGREHFSFEAGTEDEVSTLGDTMAGSVDPRGRVTPSPTPPPTSLNTPPNVVANGRQQNREQYFKASPRFQNRLSKDGSNIGSGTIIKNVSTEDTSDETTKKKFDSAVDALSSMASSQQQSDGGGFPIRRFIYFVSVAMGPILLGTVAVLIFLFVRMKQDEGDGNGNANASSSSSASSIPDGLIQTTVPTASPSVLGRVDTVDDKVDTAPSAEPTVTAAWPSPTGTPTTLSPTTAPIGTPIVATSMPTVRPTRFPTTMPTNYPTRFPTDSPTTSKPTVEPTRLPTSMPTLSQPPRLDVRFQLWQDLIQSADTLTLSALTNGLGYNETSWNRPGTLELEWSSYENVLDGGPYTSFSMRTIGFVSASQWDCWVNHYTDFGWDELSALETNNDDSPNTGSGGPKFERKHSRTAYGEQIQGAYETLGWSEDFWEGYHPADWPTSEFKRWTELTEDEQHAARILCYTKESWDRMPLQKW